MLVLSERRRLEYKLQLAVCIDRSFVVTRQTKVCTLNIVCSSYVLFRGVAGGGCNSFGGADTSEAMKNNASESSNEMIAVNAACNFRRRAV